MVWGLSERGAAQLNITRPSAHKGEIWDFKRTINRQVPGRLHGAVLLVVP